MQWDSGQEGFDVYRTRDYSSITVRSLQDIDPNATIYSDRQTRFKQGQLANCWLAAAIESLRRESGGAFHTVVPENCGDLEFRFWHKGAHHRTVRLASDVVPTEGKDPIFMHSVKGSEYWGILLEKAYAKWVGSYEGLEEGFWTDAIQSFTGGVVERIKIGGEDRNVDGNLFDIMLTSYTNGSSLCCIKKVPGNKEQYHACCIVQIDEDGTRQIHVLDPFTQKDHVWSYEEFIGEYHRVDMCHTNLDNLSALQGKNILQTPWEKRMYQLQLENGCAEFNINLTGTGDEQESSILVIELIQKIKPDEGEEPRHIKPWEAVVCLDVEVNDEAFAIEVPQESRCFFLNPGTHGVKVSTDAEKCGEIYMRLFSKTRFEVEPNERLINVATHCTQ